MWNLVEFQETTTEVITILPNSTRTYLVKKGYAVVYKLQTAVYYDDYYGIKADDNKGKIAAGDIILYRCNNKKCRSRIFIFQSAMEPRGLPRASITDG